MPFLIEEIKHFTNHISEYVWFGCVISTLLANRSDIKGYYPLAYFDGYSDDVLPISQLSLRSLRDPIFGLSRLLENQLYVRLMSFPALSMTVSSTQRVIPNLQRVAGLSVMAHLTKVEAIWHPAVSKSFLDRKILHTLMAEYTLFLSIDKVCTK